MTVRLFSLYTILLILSYTTLTGCQEQEKQKPADNTEIKYTYYRGGKVESESQFVNGVRHGYRKFFDEEGRLISEANYVNGKREGKMKTWYPDGKLWMSVSFVNDLMHGEVLEFYPDGKMSSKKMYENNKMVYNAHYTPEGKLEYEERF